MKKLDKTNDDYVYYWVGQNLRKFRKEKGLSQSKLARECNYSDTFISNIENNAYQTFSLNTLYHISRILDVPMRNFFDDLD